MSAGPIALCLPDRDFDPTEAVVPWDALRAASIDVAVATARGPDGPAPEADPRVLGHPLLRALGLCARPEVAARWRVFADAPERRRPALTWAELDPERQAGLLLPGGHWARGMRPYLESLELRAAVRRFLQAGRPVGAICHGVVVLARAFDPAGRPALDGRRVTALLRSMELPAWLGTCWALGSYYRTYRETVEAEVTRAVGPRGTFERGPAPRLGYAAGDPGFALRDGRLVTARWPGDAWTFAQDLVDLVRAPG